MIDFTTNTWTRGVWRTLSAATVLTPDDIDVTIWRSIARVVGHPLALNLMSFSLLSLLSFRQNAAYLFHGLDGRYEVSLIGLSDIFVPPLLGFSNDFIHGLGNVWFSVNPAFLPEYFLSLNGRGDFNDFPLAYTIAATDFFLTTYVAARLLGVSRPVALVSAWLVPMLTMQYAGWNLVPSTFRAFPHYATVDGILVLVSTTLILIARLPPPKVALAAVCAFLGISYVVIVSPTLLILGAPLVAISGLASLVAAARREQFFLRIAAMLSIPALCLGCGYASFLLGLTADSAATFFPNLSIRPGGLSEASMLFWSPRRPFFTVERSFILLGLAGGVWTVFRARSVLRIAATSYLATESLYLAVGIGHAFYPFWLGPAPWYFEDFLAPLHGIFASIVALEPFRIGARLWPSRLSFFRSHQLSALGPLLAVAIAVVPWFYLHLRQARLGPPDLPYYEPFPQRETAITRILKDEIALKPGEPFRGREATLTGRIFLLSTNVDIVGLSSIPDVLGMMVTGNLHSYAGLWQDSIPTLLEYSPLMTPAYFAFGRAFFTEPADRQIRDVLAMRRLDPRMLAAVGVRFVITDAPFEGDARLLQTISVPVKQETLKRLGLPSDIPSFSLRLYELPGVNLGQYSPIVIRRAATASEILTDLADPSLDLSQTAVMSATIDRPLIPGHLNSFIVGRGSFQVSASSNGWSLLVLPLEYSRCLRLDTASESGGAGLYRVDLLLTGVLFNKALDARLTYRTGPFIGSRCRIDDAREMKAIDMSDAFENRPDLAPKPIIRY